MTRFSMVWPSTRRPRAGRRGAPAIAIAIAIAVLAAWLGAAAANAQQAAAGALDVTVNDGRLTLRAISQPLDDVLEAIAREAEFELTLDGDLSAPISQVFVDVALDAGIRELTRAHIAVLWHGPSSGEEQRITALRVYQKSSPSQAAPNARPGGARSTRGAGRNVPPAAEPATGDSVATLREQLRSNPDVDERADAVDRLADIGTTAAIIALGQGLRDRSPEIRAQVIGLLTENGSRDAVLMLGRGLSQEADADLKVTMIEGLATIHTPEAKRYVRSVINDRVPEVREAAQQAMEDMSE